MYVMIIRSFRHRGVRQLYESNSFKCFMKHLNEFILCAYTGHRHEAIFLTGIPDIRESLPHA